MSDDPSEKQGAFCLEQHGYTDCTEYVAPCRCKSYVDPSKTCLGRLAFDGVNKAGTHAFLQCTVCACTYVVTMKP